MKWRVTSCREQVQESPEPFLGKVVREAGIAGFSPVTPNAQLSLICPSGACYSLASQSCKICKVAALWLVDYTLKRFLELDCLPSPVEQTTWNSYILKSSEQVTPRSGFDNRRHFSSASKRRSGGFRLYEISRTESATQRHSWARASPLPLGVAKVL